jgi:HSP20 family protein
VGLYILAILAHGPRSGCADPAERGTNHATMPNVAFSRWDPLRDLIALHEQIGQLVGTDAPGWTPPVDLYETASDYILTADLPGLSRDQIDISVVDNRVVIRGERVGGPGDMSCEQFHRVERGHGRFSRSFALPEAIDVADVSADLKDGILTVRIPKARGRGARRVAVTA